MKNCLKCLQNEYSKRYIAFGNLDTPGAYGILTGIGEMQVGEQRRDGSFAALNDNTIYNFLKLPLIGLSLIGGQRLFWSKIILF